MTDALNPTVPAGWYPDPWGSASQRWWDGTVWTDRLDPPAQTLITPQPGPSPVPDAPPLGPSLPSRRSLRELSTAVEEESSAPPSENAVMTEAPPSQTADSAAALPAYTQAPEFSPEPVSAVSPPVWTEPVEPPPVAEPVPTAALVSAAPASAQPTAADDDGWAASLSRWDIPDPAVPSDDVAPIFGDAPPVSYSQRAMRYKPLHGRTLAVWLIVFMPLVQLTAMMGSMLVFPGLLQFDGRVAAFVPTADAVAALLSLRDWLLYAALPLTVAFFLFTFVLGFQDRSRLRLLGHDEAASAWWIVLSPLVYLIVRSVRVRQSTGRRGSGPLTTYACLYIAPPIALIVAQAVSSALYGAIPI
ncbi:MAG: DUF2510 domain-containing protein [Homoserinimonas sp.]